MSEVTLKAVLFILIISTVAGALASLLVIAVRVANTRLGKKMLITSAGRTLLRVYGVKQLIHRLDRNLLYEIAFAEMAHDQAYQDEARRLAAEFVSSDWEAFQIAEQYG